MKETTFYVDGMSCTGCAQSVTAALGAKEGIMHVKVDFDTRKAVVQYDDQKMNEERIKTLLKEMGYGFRRTASAAKARK